MGDSRILGLGFTPEDIGIEDLIKLVCRNLARIEVQLSKLNETEELKLKLAAMQAGLSLESIQEASFDAGSPPAEGKEAAELLSQTPEELAQLEGAFGRLEQRFGRGRVPLSADLYSELAKMQPDNLEEEP